MQEFPRNKQHHEEIRMLGGMFDLGMCDSALQNPLNGFKTFN